MSQEKWIILFTCERVMRIKLKSWTGVRCLRGLGLRLHPNSLGRISQLLIFFFAWNIVLMLIFFLLHHNSSAQTSKVFAIIRLVAFPRFYTILINLIQQVGNSSPLSLKRAQIPSDIQVLHELNEKYLPNYTSPLPNRSSLHSNQDAHTAAAERNTLS